MEKRSDKLERFLNHPETPLSDALIAGGELEEVVQGIACMPGESSALWLVVGDPNTPDAAPTARLIVRGHIAQSTRAASGTHAIPFAAQREAALATVARWRSDPTVLVPDDNARVICELVVWTPASHWVVATCSHGDALSPQAMFDGITLDPAHTTALAERFAALRHSSEVSIRQRARAAALLAVRLLQHAKETAGAENDAATLRERLEQLEGRIERQKLHTASLVHDMRTPLSAILGHLDLFDMGVYGHLEDEQHEALRNMRERGSRLLELIRNVLDYARIDRGVMPLVPTSFSLADVVTAAVGHVQAAADRKGLALRVEWSGRAVDTLVFGSERRMEQVLTNLLANAVKFTDQGSVQIFGWLPEPDTIELIVSDTGRGISPDDQALIFEPYARSHNGAHRTGAGLGLAIVVGLLEQMGGTIRVESTYGVGSRFYVRVPVKLAPQG